MLWRLLIVTMPPRYVQFLEWSWQPAHLNNKSILYLEFYAADVG